MRNTVKSNLLVVLFYYPLLPQFLCLLDTADGEKSSRQLKAETK